MTGAAGSPIVLGRIDESFHQVAAARAWMGRHGDDVQAWLG